MSENSKKTETNERTCNQDLSGFFPKNQAMTFSEFLIGRFPEILPHIPGSGDINSISASLVDLSQRNFRIYGMLLDFYSLYLHLHDGGKL